MSEKKLNVQQKLFAVIEGLLRDTRIKSVNLDVPMKVEETGLEVLVETQEIPLEMSAKAEALDTKMECLVVSAVDELTNAAVNDGGIEDLNTAVIDEKVEAIRFSTVLEENVDLSVPIRDLFKEYTINPLSVYHTVIKTANIRNLVPVLHTAQFAIQCPVKDKTGFFFKLPVEKCASVMNLVSEKDQLFFWKQAVIKTGKKARELTLVGIYHGVPLDGIETLKINSGTQSLNYYYKVSALDLHKSRTPLRDVAIFFMPDSEKAVKVIK